MPGKPPHELRNLLTALWWYPGAQGIKTGWTERAGQVRVVAAQRGGTRLVAVVMDSPDDVGEIRDLLDYGFATGGKADAQASVPLGADGFPAPDARLPQAWETYKQLALNPDGRIKRGASGADATADTQAEALLHAVWFRDRAAFDSIWSWTKVSLSRQASVPDNPFRDALFAGRWSRGAVTDWNNSTGADERIGAALLLASKLWNEPRYARDAKPVLDAILSKAAISWSPKLGVPAANSFLKELEPMTTSAATFTPAFYRMFAEATRNGIWLWLVDGTYVTLDRAAAPTGPLGGGAGMLPAWFSVSHGDGTVGAPIDPTWQTTGFGDPSAALVMQLALDSRWFGEPRALALLQPTARVLAADLTQRQRVAAAYARNGGAASSTETAAYGALAGITLPGLQAQAAVPLRAKLDAALASRDPDRLLGAIDGVWMLAGGPPNYWRIWWAPEDLPTTRNDGVVPPADGTPWRYFPETGHVVQGRFLDYFMGSGQIATFGLPRTDEMTEDGRLVQYFQRGRLEYHPERAGTDGEVVLASLGSQTAVSRGILPRPEARRTAAFESDEQRLYVPETGHSLQGGFRAFYEGAGGAAVLGHPITEELFEDGFTVQYFERAVLDYQPGKPVQAELLGDDLLRTKGWLK
jgi:hypothetical protein